MWIFQAIRLTEIFGLRALANDARGEELAELHHMRGFALAGIVCKRADLGDNGRKAAKLKMFLVSHDSSQEYIFEILQNVPSSLGAR